MKRVRELVVAVALGAAAFALSHRIETRLDALGAFEQFDVLFDADPNAGLRAFGEGYRGHAPAYVHPLLASYFSPLIARMADRSTSGAAATDVNAQVAGNAAGDAGATAPPPPQVRDARRRMSLLVVPIASGLQAAVLCLLFSSLGFSLVDAGLLAAFAGVSFSQLVFGSMPDHYALAGAGLAVLFALAARTRPRGRMPWPAWVAVGVLLTGVTITNLVLVALVMWISLAVVRDAPAAASARTAAVLAASGAIVFAAALALRPDPAHAVRRDANWVEKHFRSDAPVQLLRFPSAVANTIAPARPKVLERRSQRAMRYTFQLGLGTRPSVVGMIGVAAAALGAYCWLAAGRTRHLALAALAVVAWNGVLHAVWGDDYFLYSQHWHVALVVLVAGVLAIDVRRRGVRTLAFAAFVLLVAAHNADRLGYVLDTLEARAQTPAGPSPGR